MALSPRTRLGPYEVIDQIGIGGMGEVYRATDTNLGRHVAIKVLPDALASDTERLARFDREARTLAALNHPNIAAIYDVEKSGGTTALVMELVGGPTLADHSHPQSEEPVIQYQSGGVMARLGRTAGLAFILVFASITAVQIHAQKWSVPRTADGRPDLEGVWENNSATPLERPRQLADKPRLTDEELESMKRRAATLFGPNAEATFGDALYQTLLANTTPLGLGNTGSYSQNWLPDRYFEHRTSLIVDPADGKLPPPTAAGAKLRATALGRFGRVGSSAQDMSLQDRCIHYGFPDLFAAYMAVYRIVQTPQYVAIQFEKIHDTRVIPLDGTPHLSSSIRNYMGDSRGNWEGDTLVVETTNFHPKGNPMGGYNTLSDENLRLIERFRRTADDTIEYTFTVDNPTMWTKPWTATINWKRSRGELLEYACHEGNYSLRGMLSAARAEEAEGKR